MAAKITTLLSEHIERYYPNPKLKETLAMNQGTTGQQHQDPTKKQPGHDTEEEQEKKKKEEEEKKKQQPHPGSSGGQVPGSGNPSGGYQPGR